MTMVVCKCPRCKAELKFNANGSQPVVRIHCPKCRHAFNAQVRKQQSETPPAPLSQLTVEDLSPQPIAPYSPFPQSHTSHGSGSQSPGNHWSNVQKHSRANSTNSSSTLKIILGFVGGVAVLGMFTAVAVSLFLKRGTLPDLAKATQGIVGFDSPESIASELERLREKVQSTANQIPESDRQTSGANRLKQYQPEFDALFLRACRLSTVSRSLEQMVSDAQRMEDRRKQFQQQSATQFNDPNQAKPFWINNLSASPDDYWQRAINGLVESYSSALRANDAQVEYPNPLQQSDNPSNLTDEDRRLLAVYWLQGKAARTFVQQFSELTQLDQLSDSQLKDVFDTIDRIASEGMEIAKVPSSQGRVIIDVPKGSMYEYQSKAALSALMHLMAKVDRDKRPSREQLLEVMGLGLRLTEKLEDIQFGRADFIHKFTQQSSWSLFLQRRQELADKKKAAEQEQERERLAALQRERSEQEAAEKRRREDEARAQKMAEDRAKENEKPSSDAKDLTGGPATPGMNPGGFGFPPGFRGPGPRGNDPGKRGPGIPGPGIPGPGFSGPVGQDGSMDPSMPNFGGGRSGPPKFQPPQMTEQGVTIVVEKVDSKQHVAITDEVQKSFPNHMINTSGGQMIIKIISFEHPLAEIARMIPLIIIDSIDEKSRTLRARAK